MADDWTAPSPDGSPVSLSMRKRDPFAVPFLTPEIIQKVIADGERPVRQYLDRNHGKGGMLSLNALVVEVCKMVPGAAEKGVVELKYIIRDWARKSNVSLPPMSTPPHPADRPARIEDTSESSLIKAIKDAVKTAKDGVTVRAGAFETKVSISGATAKLGPFGTAVSPTGDVSGTITTGEGKITVGPKGVSSEIKDGTFKIKHSVSWEGEIKLDTSYEKFRFVGAISPKTWSLTLTFNTKDMPPYPGAIADIFAKGETGVRGILHETAGFENLDEIPDLAKKIEPHLKPVKQAIGTAGILAGLKSHVSFGAKISGPGPSAGAAERQKGVSAMVVLTISF